MPKPEPRIFLDSNVIFSALYSPKRAPGIILEHFLNGRIKVVVSQQVLEEVVRTTRVKLPQALPALRTLLSNVPPEVVRDPLAAEIVPWRKRLALGDASILAAAVAAQPDFFVTGDRHFSGDPGIAKESGLQIVNPAQLLKFLRE